MFSSRSIRALVIAATAAVAVSLPLAAGCGETSPTFDPATAYSPASLAQELVFRYKALDPAKRNVRKAQPPRKPDAAAAKEKKAATKDAQATTLDDLVRDVTTKAGSVPGMTATEVLRKVADEVGKDPSVPEADRKTIADRLRGEGA